MGRKLAFALMLVSVALVSAFAAGGAPENEALVREKARNQLNALREDLLRRGPAKRVSRTAIGSIRRSSARAAPGGVSFSFNPPTRRWNLLSLRTQIFRALAQVSIRRPYLVLICAVALSIASVFYTKARLEFHTGQDDLITPNSRASRDYLGYTREFPDLDGLIIVVRAAPDRARSEHFVDALAARLNADHANVKTVFYKIDAGAFADRAMLYMKNGDLDVLAQKIRAGFPMLHAYAADPSLAGFFTMVNSGIDRQMQTQMRAQMHPGGLRMRLATPTTVHPRFSPGAVAKQLMPTGTAEAPGALDTGAIDTVLGGMRADADHTKYVSPWQSLMQAGGQDNAQANGYLLSDNGKYLLLHVAPGDGVKDGPDPTKAIQNDVDAVRANFPGLTAGMTGGPALAHAEESTTAHDIALASLIAIGSNVLLLVVPFTAVVEPFFAILALLAGVTWSFGFTTLAVGHLNLLSAVFTSVLAGIGINFPIHLMARYDEARRRGHTMSEALELAVVNTGTGVFASACIMALAFLSALFTDFKGIAELGLISAAGLFMCLLSAMLVFPALIALRDRNRTAPAAPRLSMALSRSFLEKLFARPGVIVGVSVVATLAATFLVRGVGFDQNILKLQAGNAEAVRYENILLRDSGRSSWFAVALAPTRDAAESEAATFRELPEVSDVETITTYLPDHQAEKRALLNALRADVAPIEIRAPARTGSSRALARNLSDLAYKLDALARTARSSDEGK